MNADRFYRNFSIMVTKEDCQIVKIKQLKNGKFKVRVRTILNETYDVKCNWNGKIISLKINDKNKMSQ